MILLGEKLLLDNPLARPLFNTIPTFAARMRPMVRIHDYLSKVSIYLPSFAERRISNYFFLNIANQSLKYEIEHLEDIICRQSPRITHKKFLTPSTLFFTKRRKKELKHGRTSSQRHERQEPTTTTILRHHAHEDELEWNSHRDGLPRSDHHRRRPHGGLSWHRSAMGGNAQGRR